MQTRRLIVACVAMATAAFFATPAAAQQGQRRYPGYHQQDQSQRITCSSRSNRHSLCRVNWRDAQLVQQLSHASCVRGRSWGIDRQGLWVDHGCRGVFAEARGRRGGGHGRHVGSAWRAINLTCQSQDSRYKFCQVDTGSNGSVRLEQQLSNAACVRGSTWGWNRAGVWVDRGCRGRFVVERRW